MRALIHFFLIGFLQDKQRELAQAKSSRLEPGIPMPRRCPRRRRRLA